MKEQAQEQFQLQDLQKILKQKIFNSSRNFLQHCESINPLFIYLIIIIEAFQIIWFTLHPSMQPLGNPQALTYIRTALQYINFQYPIVKNNDLLQVFVGLSFGIIMLSVLTIGISIVGMNAKKTQIMNVINKLSAFQFVLINTIFTIPIFNVSFITLYCDNNSMYHVNRQCYNPQHIILCVLSSINLIFLLISTLLYWFIFYHRNPFSKSYFALYTNLFRLGKLLLKILPPLYFVIDVHKEFQGIYNVIFVILSIVYIGFFRISSIHNFYQNYFYLQLFMQGVIAWFCINLVICFQIQSSGMNFIQSTISSFIFAFAICSIQSQITRRFFIQNLDSTVKKQDRQKFIYIMIGKLFQQGGGDINPLVYIKMLNSNLDNSKINGYLNRNDLKVQQVQQVSRQVMLALLQKFLQQLPSINLRLVKCQLLYDCGLRILSLHQVSQLRNDKLQTYQQFLIYNFKSTHKAFQSSQLKGSQDNITQIQTYLKFIQNMNQFQNQLQACSINNQQYWEQLCQDAPSSNKIYNLAKRSMKYTKKIEQMFKKIQQIFPQNLSALILYFQFLNDVCVRYKQCNKIKQKLNLQKQRQSQKQSTDIQNHNLKIKFKANQRMCVLHVSTTKSTIGIVLNCNSQVKRYLGFQRSQIINQKVTKIMPKIYSQIHDKFIDDYLKKADAIKLPVQKTVFAFKKNLKIIQTCLAVKIFPNVVNGFQLVGFFKQKNAKQDICNIMVNLKTDQIQGMSQGFLTMTGNKINLTQIQKQPLKINHLFSDYKSSDFATRGNTFQANFKFSDCTDRLIDFQSTQNQKRKKFEKKVSITVQSINQYQDGQIIIAVLVIKDKQQIQSMQDFQRQLRPSDPKILKQKSKSKLLQKKQIRSFNQSANQDQISIERKVQDFISTQSNQTKLFFLYVLMVIFFFGLILSSILITVLKTSNTNDQQTLLNQISLAANISIIQGKIVNLNKDMIQMSNDPDKWNYKKNLYNQALTQLQKTIITLFQKANQRKQNDLIINTFKHYNFSTKFKGSNKSTTTNLYYTDGIQQAVFLAKSILDKNISFFQQPINQDVYQTNYFVQSNFKQMLPQLANKTIQAYRQLLQQKLNWQFLQDVYITSIKAFLFLAFYLILSFLLNKFSKYNQIIIKIYNNILKWDAYQLYTKCVNFRNKTLQITSVKQQNSGRNSDIMKVFPKSLLVLLSQNILTGRGNGQPKTSIMANINNSNTFQNSQKQQQQPFNNKQNNTTKKILQSGPNGLDLIHLTIQKKITKKFFIFFFILIILLGITFIFLYTSTQSKQKMMIEIQNTLTFSKFSKSFLYLYFYGTQILDNDIQYLKYYQKQLNYFYQISKQLSIIIVDNQNYLHNVYRQVQLLNSLVRGDLSTLDPQKKKQYILQMQNSLFQINNKLIGLSLKTSINANRYLDSDRQQTRLLKMCIQIIIFLIFYQLIKVYLFTVVQNLILHSSNMMKMVPTWIVYKNQILKDIICGNNRQQQDIKKKKNQQKKQMDSSSGLMSNSGF